MQAACIRQQFGVDPLVKAKQTSTYIYIFLQSHASIGAGYHSSDAIVVVYSRNVMHTDRRS